MAKLIIKGLNKRFGHIEVLRDISFEVHEGEFCILLGPSGCGKTTILRIIAGLEQQDSGEIFINGREISHLSPRHRNVAMVFQSYALYPHMNVFENMAFSLKIKKLERQKIEQKVKEAARLLGIEELLNRMPKELSGGQRQRVAIGRAIVRDPELFLFDEPLSNLDAKLRSNMRVELARLHQKLNATTIYVTHDQVEAMTLGEKIIILNQGIIQQMGTPDDVYHRPENLFVASFIGTPQINLINGILKREDKNLYITNNDLKLNLDFQIPDELNQYVGKELTLGIRPEAIMIGKGNLRVKVEWIEHLGSEDILYLRIKDCVLRAKVGSDTRISKGDLVNVSILPVGTHLFYKEKRIFSPFQKR